MRRGMPPKRLSFPLLRFMHTESNASKPQQLLSLLLRGPAQLAEGVGNAMYATRADTSNTVQFFNHFWQGANICNQGWASLQSRFNHYKAKALQTLCRHDIPVGTTIEIGSILIGQSAM